MNRTDPSAAVPDPGLLDYPTSDESTVGWGEHEPEQDEDAWLLAERPPHW